MVYLEINNFKPRKKLEKEKSLRQFKQTKLRAFFFLASR